jgi:hypothetical protein
VSGAIGSEFGVFKLLPLAGAVSVFYKK